MNHKGTKYTKGEFLRYNLTFRLLFIALPITIISTGLILSNLHSQIKFPERYPFSISLPGNDNRRTQLQEEIAFYRQRVRQNPQSGLDSAALARSYLKMAKSTGDSSWYLLAEQTAQRSLANLSINNNGAVLVLARIAQAKHDFAEAIRLSQQILKLQPTNEDALAILTTSNLAMGKLSEAEKAADTLVNKIPTQGSLTLQALVQVAQGRDKEAIDTYKLALATEEAGEIGSSAWTRVLMGKFYYKHGEIAQAEKLYNEALRILPRYPLALLHLAELETRKGNYTMAETYYAQVSRNSQQTSTVFDHVVFRGKAKLLQLQGKEQEANKLLNQAEALLRQETANGHGDGSFGHRRELAQLLLEKGQDVSEALSLMQTEVKIRRDAQTLDTLAWALSRSGRFQEAQKVIKEALQLGTRDAAIFYRAGIIEKALLNNQQAVAYEKLAKEVDPSFDQQAQRLLGLGTENIEI
jgi:tetratricopeptide (TPR) repeat protein